MDYELDLEDPVGSIIEKADRFLSSQKDTLVSSFAAVLGDVLGHGGEGYAGRSVRGEPPPAPRPPNGARQGQGRPTPRERPAQPPPPPAPPKESPRDVLGFSKEAKLTRKIVKERQRALAKLWHSDVGGSVKAMQRLNVATAELLKTVKG